MSVINLLTYFATSTSYIT